MVTEDLIRKAIKRGQWNVWPMAMLLATFNFTRFYPLPWQRTLIDCVMVAILVGWVIRLIYVMRHPLVPGIQEEKWWTPRRLLWVVAGGLIFGAIAGSLVGWRLSS